MQIAVGPAESSSFDEYRVQFSETKPDTEVRWGLPENQLYSGVLTPSLEYFQTSGLDLQIQFALVFEQTDILENLINHARLRIMMTSGIGLSDDPKKKNDFKINLRDALKVMEGTISDIPILQPLARFWWKRILGIKSTHIHSSEFKIDSEVLATASSTFHVLDGKSRFEKLGFVRFVESLLPQKFHAPDEIPGIKDFKLYQEASPNMESIWISARVKMTADQVRRVLNHPKLQKSKSKSVQLDIGALLGVNMFRDYGEGASAAAICQIVSYLGPKTSEVVEVKMEREEPDFLKIVRKIEAGLRLSYREALYLFGIMVKIFEEMKKYDSLIKSKTITGLLLNPNKGLNDLKHYLQNLPEGLLEKFKRRSRNKK